MVRLIKYAVVVPARNEEKYIERTLFALKKQTVPPDQIIVVDDGSKDRTGQIASKYADFIVRLPDRGHNALRKPELAEVVNEGLRRVKKDVDYVLICGADHALPKDYFEVVISRMKANPKMVVASGRIGGEPYFEFGPNGSGRVVDAKFWREVSDLQYPLEWGWESWLFYKAMQLGYEVRCFRDVVTEVQRPTTLGKAMLGGKAMYALGYDWKYALGRCVITFFKSPKAGLGMFWGWLLHRDVKRFDIADWVNQWQKSLFWKRVQTIIKRGGRK